MDLRDPSACELAPCADSPADSDGSQVFGAAMQSLGPVTGNAIFLHTGWRSGGTWIWSRCRALPRVCGFYEPLHEQAGQFRRRDVAVMRPGSWQSNHSDTPPYFEEYRDLIPERGRGVAHYNARFAFDDFFKAPADPSDLELETYLGALVARPHALGKLPVLKFCRSMGRVGWLESLFPQALHLVVLRDPLSQFQSIQRLLRRQRNRYFALAPLLVLARNAQTPVVREAALSLGVTLPRLFSGDMDYAVETCWRHVRRMSPAEQYRGFLAFWTVSAMAALDSEAQIIDIDALGPDLEHRRSVEAALRGRIGEPVNLLPREATDDGAAPPPGFVQAHAAALTLVRQSRHRLPDARLHSITSKLEASLEATNAPVWAAGWRLPALPPPSSQRSVPQRFATGAVVAMARAVQPLRRLHGAMVWRRLG